ncbi:MAG: hypothetical protein A2821_04145 [Candidatus Magasanikbacteria bacterium RIFCSPHIGHO2_01_FULL_41_23]|nr:MAG: hypothetical protein A2821_04145 [Candidatus Magasanikbacteria bacterium RIFCSPHIGHO2_01_FULL_41_23]OGH67233.1 MAG: hypothetical protein A3C66_00625 [Candidatus Magasanikbacteria bacterium RIFCSPHIGHO2_02_FULL_41_35]
MNNRNVSASNGGGVLSSRNKIHLTHKYEDIVCVSNLLSAWQEFEQGKSKKTDVVEFSRHLMDHILALHRDLVNLTYCHGGYREFRINDPKPRVIHKASVRDRLVHHAVYRILYPFFDRTFIADSFSCRNNKGTHKAINRFRKFGRQVSHNHTRTVWVLKCDIRKFFASVDQRILLHILDVYIPDKKIVNLLYNIIASFSATPYTAVGLPLGNLTSQLFSNIYLNQFDQWVKHKIKVKHYIRYADDFVFLSDNRNALLSIISELQNFLTEKLKLQLHPNKVFIKTIASGVDFLGWILFPSHRVLRKVTKQRMLRRLAKNFKPETLQSYLGMLSHGNTFRLRQSIKNDFWLLN